MKIAVTNSDKAYAEKMKDASGNFAVNYLEFVRNLLLEVGVKQDFLLDWDFGIGLENEEIDLEGNYDVFEVTDFVGYLVLEYQRDLKNNIENLSNRLKKEEHVTFSH